MKNKFSTQSVYSIFNRYRLFPLPNKILNNQFYLVLKNKTDFKF